MSESPRDAIERAKRYAKWRMRAFIRYLQMAALMFVAAVVIPIIMISLGLLLGPRGYEGLIATPLAVLVSWGLILFWGLGRRVTPKKIARTRLAELPVQTGQWLEAQRLLLPADAMPNLDGILDHLEHLGPQLQRIADAAPAATQLRRLLVEELSVLVDHYTRLPQRLRSQPLHGGPSPERQLVSGLATIHAELGRIHDKLASDDLHSLATKQRYLELKYHDDSKE